MSPALPDVRPPPAPPRPPAAAPGPARRAGRCRTWASPAGRAGPAPGRAENPTSLPRRRPLRRARRVSSATISSASRAARRNWTSGAARDPRGAGSSQARPGCASGPPTTAAGRGRSPPPPDARRAQEIWPGRPAALRGSEPARYSCASRSAGVSRTRRAAAGSARTSSASAQSARSISVVGLCGRARSATRRSSSVARSPRACRRERWPRGRRRRPGERRAACAADRRAAGARPPRGAPRRRRPVAVARRAELRRDARRAGRSPSPDAASAATTRSGTRARTSGGSTARTTGHRPRRYGGRGGGRPRRAARVSGRCAPPCCASPGPGARGRSLLRSAGVMSTKRRPAASVKRPRPA